MSSKQAELAQRIKRAADILHRYTTQDAKAKGIQRAVNNAFNVLEPKRPEEAAEAITEKS